MIPWSVGYDWNRISVDVLGSVGIIHRASDCAYNSPESPTLVAAINIQTATKVDLHRTPQLRLPFPVGDDDFCLDFPLGSVGLDSQRGHRIDGVPIVGQRISCISDILRCDTRGRVRPK
jgi:hypothetical protein